MAAESAGAEAKYARLVSILEELERVVVAFSGGVDSTFLLKVATDVLGENALGVLAYSESLDRNEFSTARDVAQRLGVPIRVVETREYDNPAYRRNDRDRCYHCKAELFDRLLAFARDAGFRHVADGSNHDDLGDFRPGMLARRERGVRSPLLEAGLSKEEIRGFSRRLGLPTWDKPAAPCLSSRIPYGSEVSYEKLRQVEAAEAALRELGFRTLRVRHHGAVARIELPPAEFTRLLEPGGAAAAVVARVKAAGFSYVALDLEGFRSGSLNEAPAGDAPAVSAPPAGPGGLVPLSEIRRLP